MDGEACAGHATPPCSAGLARAPTAAPAPHPLLLPHAPSPAHRTITTTTTTTKTTISSRTASSRAEAFGWPEPGPPHAAGGWRHCRRACSARLENPGPPLLVPLPSQPAPLCVPLEHRRDACAATFLFSSRPLSRSAWCIACYVLLQPPAARLCCPTYPPILPFPHPLRLCHAALGCAATSCIPLDASRATLSHG